MLDKNDSKPPIDLSDLGGRQISGPVVSGNSAKPVDLSDLGGKPLNERVASEPPKDDTN